MVWVFFWWDNPFLLKHHDVLTGTLHSSSSFYKYKKAYSTSMKQQRLAPGGPWGPFQPGIQCK